MFNLHIMRKVVVKSETYTIKNCFATAVNNTTRDNMSVKKCKQTNHLKVTLLCRPKIELFHAGAVKKYT